MIKARFPRLSVECPDKVSDRLFPPIPKTAYRAATVGEQRETMKAISTAMVVLPRSDSSPDALAYLIVLPIDIRL